MTNKGKNKSRGRNRKQSSSKPATARVPSLPATSEIQPVSDPLPATSTKPNPLAFLAIRDSTARDEAFAYVGQINAMVAKGWLCEEQGLQMMLERLSFEASQSGETHMQAAIASSTGLSEEELGAIMLECDNGAGPRNGVGGAHSQAAAPSAEQEEEEEEVSEDDDDDDDDEGNSDSDGDSKLSTPPRSLPFQVCPPQHQGIITNFATLLICKALCTYHRRTTLPPASWMNSIRRWVIAREMALLSCMFTKDPDAESDKLIMTSIHAHAALMCAQEYSLKVPDAHVFDPRVVSNLLQTDVAQLSGLAAARDHAQLSKFVNAWAGRNTTEQRDVYVEKLDGIQVGDRPYDLQVHFARGQAWPRTWDDKRIIPFGVPDFRDKIDFEEGETKRDCVKCDKEFTSMRAWKKHVLTTNRHEVYLCCGCEFFSRTSVLEHLLGAHDGDLGRLDPYIYRRNLPMDMEE